MSVSDPQAGNVSRQISALGAANENPNHLPSCENWPNVLEFNG
jgi:hypothetical protein